MDDLDKSSQEKLDKIAARTDLGRPERIISALDLLGITRRIFFERATVSNGLSAHEAVHSWVDSL